MNKHLAHAIFHSSHWRVRSGDTTVFLLKFQWNIYEDIKLKLSNATLFVFSSARRDISVVVDASDIAIEAELISCEDNVVADRCLRIYVVETQQLIYYEEIAKKQSRDPELAMFSSSSLTLK